MQHDVGEVVVAPFNSYHVPPQCLKPDSNPEDSPADGFKRPSFVLLGHSLQRAVLVSIADTCRLIFFNMNGFTKVNSVVKHSYRKAVIQLPT